MDGYDELTSEKLEFKSFEGKSKAESIINNIRKQAFDKLNDSSQIPEEMDDLIDDIDNSNEFNEFDQNDEHLDSNLSDNT